MDRVQGQSAFECSTCHGNRFIPVIREVTGIYAEPRTMEFWKPCPACSGQLRADDIGLPGEFCDADLSKFNFGIYNRDMSKLKEIAESFAHNFAEDWFKTGFTLYLWSKSPGSGKTFLACCIARMVAVKSEYRVRFITVIDYLEILKRSYKNVPGALNREADCDKYMNCDLLVLDDCGCEKSSDWSEAEVFRLINGRMNNGLPIIFTSNYPLEKSPYSERIVSRIYRACIRVQMPEQDIRCMLGDERQRRFLEKILK